MKTITISTNPGSTNPGSLHADSFASSNRAVLPIQQGTVGEFRMGLFASQSQSKAWFIGPLPEPWSLRRPILLDIEVDDDGTYIASDGDLGVYGSGDTEDEAKDDYLASLVEYCEILSQDSGAANVKPLLRRLRAFVLRAS